MRVAVLYFPGRKLGAMEDMAKALAQGIGSQGHDVDLINGEKELDKKLSMYKYIAIGAVSEGFFSAKMPEALKRYLKNAGILGGKKSFAFSLKGGLRTTRALANLMAVLESEGMFLKFSEVLSNREEATAIGKRLHID